ncbi:hypothetical protein GUITHDRAFT_146804 [Guillardia theta CCMP2712]|uniref:Methyltransferase small domain-containing protein n=1 Tax=Guillardia theta (strain CCMP2712) TaxID=905079 RepID=L1IFL4_GUITC|nr:hypothetical protein GUITHDRAFT_146804 [Guillardia theta CCMP2712]EKX35051.1 hypothetical protein GUITHDRAFT_146804 [Guillardia theta CCMP2712]|eukprot:XP_005822031.1 hypothetical protein GUITHDRAFT_146804 [Guillardia theta CCMP2712]
MSLRPDWAQWDGKFVTSTGINDALRDFSSKVDEKEENKSVRDAIVLRDLLASIGYTAANVQQRFGLAGAKTAGPFYLRRRFDHRHAHLLGMQTSPRDELDVIIRMLLLGLSLPVEQVQELLGDQVLSAMTRLSLVGPSPAIPGLLVPHVQIFPVDPSALLRGESSDESMGLLMVTDLMPPCSAALEEEPVMYIGPDSLGLVHHAPRREEEAVLDLCCGSGIQGIAAAKLYGKQVTCVDINERAVRFARFNAMINGVASRVKVLQGDLYDFHEKMGHEMGSESEVVMSQRRFNVILSNPPFVPVPFDLKKRVKRYNVFADGRNENTRVKQIRLILVAGGEDGEAVLKRIITGASRHLAAGGRVAIVTEIFCAHLLPERMKRWLIESSPLSESRGRRRWRCLVHVDKEENMYTPATYSEARAGNKVERLEWEEHLKKMRIETVGRGYIFLKAYMISYVISYMISYVISLM